MFQTWLASFIKNNLTNLTNSAHFLEATYFDRFNTTENGLEYDRMKFTPTNINLLDLTEKPMKMTEKVKMK